MIACQCENSLVGGEEKKKKGMWCIACLCPFLTTSRSSWDWQWWGVLEEGWDPCCHNALTIFCCTPQPLLNAWQAVHLQSGPQASLLFPEVSALSGYSQLGRPWHEEVYQLAMVSERSLGESWLSEVALQHGIPSSPFSLWHLITPSYLSS